MVSTNKLRLTSLVRKKLFQRVLTSININMQKSSSIMKELAVSKHGLLGN